MNRVAQASFRDVDLVLFLVEAGNWSRQDEFVAKALRSVDVPVMLVLNKVDLVPDKATLLDFIDKNFRDDDYVNIMMISAKNGSGVDELEKTGPEQAAIFKTVLRRRPVHRPQ